MVDGLIRITSCSAVWESSLYSGIQHSPHNMSLSGGNLAQARQSIKLVQSQVFGTSYNPSNVRTGLKYLRRPLKGPSAVDYIMPTYWGERERERWIAAAIEKKPLMKRKTDQMKGGPVALPEGGIWSSALLSAAARDIRSGTKRIMFTKRRTILNNPDFHPEGRPSPRFPETIPGAAAQISAAQQALNALKKTNPSEEELVAAKTKARRAISQRSIDAAIDTYRASAEARGDVPPGTRPIAFGIAGWSLARATLRRLPFAQYGTYDWLGDAPERVRTNRVRIKRALGRGPPKKGQGKRAQKKK